MNPRKIEGKQNPPNRSTCLLPHWYNHTHPFPRLAPDELLYNASRREEPRTRRPTCRYKWRKTQEKRLETYQLTQPAEGYNFACLHISIPQSIAPGLTAMRHPWLLPLSPCGREPPLPLGWLEETKDNALRWKELMACSADNKLKKKRNSNTYLGTENEKRATEKTW